jgi:hypothetical protein
MAAAVVDRPISPSEWMLLITLSVLRRGSYYLVTAPVKELQHLTLFAVRVTL